MPIGQKPNDPAGIGCVFARSNFSPIPKCSVPEITVTCSICVCQCGDTTNPSGIFKRIVNTPSFAGSPSSTTIAAPFWSESGPGPQTISDAANSSMSPMGFSSPVEAAARHRASAIASGYLIGELLLDEQIRPNTTFPGDQCVLRDRYERCFALREGSTGPRAPECGSGPGRTRQVRISAF